MTKEKYWNKPTMSSLRASLTAMLDLCISQGVKQLAMPRIGCGLDGLTWGPGSRGGGVRELLVKVFARTGVEIVVHTL